MHMLISGFKCCRRWNHTFCPVSLSDMYCFLGIGKVLSYIVTIRVFASRGDEGGWLLQYYLYKGSN